MLKSRGSMTLQCNEFVNCTKFWNQAGGNFSVSENDTDCGEITKPDPKTYTLRFRAPETWTTCYAYVYANDATFPGTPAWGATLPLSKDASGFYVYTLETELSYSAIYVIFNIRSEQVADIDIVADNNTCWQANGSNVEKIDCSPLTGTTDNQSLNLQIFPNPTSDFVTISCENLEKVEIYNFYGKKILVEKNNIVNLSEFSSGIYFLKITDKNGKIFNSKIIKK